MRLALRTGPRLLGSAERRRNLPVPSPRLPHGPRTVSGRAGGTFCLLLTLSDVGVFWAQAQLRTWRVGRTRRHYPHPEKAPSLILLMRNTPNKKSMLGALGLKGRRKPIQSRYKATPKTSLGSISLRKKINLRGTASKVEFL